MRLVLLFYLLTFILNTKCQQVGPDPWEYNQEIDISKSTEEIPADLRFTIKRKEVRDAEGIRMSEWFYKRLLTTLLKNGEIKKDDYGETDVSLNMHFTKERWEILNDYLNSETVLSEEMYRRTTGYIQEAIVKPSLMETIVLAWSDYIQLYLTEYKIYIVSITGVLSVMALVFTLWKQIKQKHVYIIIFFAIYMYEVFVSYKEAEHQEYKNFVSAVTCKWSFWSSKCEGPSPDPLLFIKHMHPLKIALRVFSTFVTQPTIEMSSALKTVLHGITDELWYPLDKIVFYVLFITMIAFTMIFAMMVLFNFILNLPFKLSFLAGLVSIGVQQRNRNIINDSTPTNQYNKPILNVDSGDRLSGGNLDKLLNLCSKVIDNRSNVKPSNSSNKAIAFHSGKMHKSASTGRLSDLVDKVQDTPPKSRKNIKYNFKKMSGDYDRK